jgi:Site-specific recombinase XerD
MQWEAKLLKYKGELRIAVYFAKHHVLIQRIKKLQGARWSSTLRCWHLPDTDAYRERFGIEKRFVQNQEHSTKIETFKRYLSSKRYAESTVKTYTESITSFLAYFNEKPISQFTPQDLIRFNNDYILKNQLSIFYQNQIVNAVKLFFKAIEHQTIHPELLHRPKREKRLPNVLSKEEVKMILDAHNNIKHRAMLSLIYSCGLRRSELLNLKPNDIDSKRGIVIIRQAKGKKDRIVPLSEKMLELLRTYYKANKPKEYLFEGQTSGEKYDERSLQQVLKHKLMKANIHKLVTLHW